MSKYINDALLGTNPNKKRQAETKILVSKWEKCGLLDGLSEGYEKNNMAQLLENQAKQLISENSKTNPTGGSDEEWSGVALPLVRRIFGEVAAQELVSVQPMNLPSGLVFYLDFKYGSALSGRTTSESLAGKTGPNSPEGSTSPFGVDGLYGAGQFGYSVSGSKTVTHDLPADGTAASALSVWNQDNAESASNAANGSYFTLAVPTSSLSGSIDEKAVRSYIIESATHIHSFLPAFTTLSGGNVTFLVSGSSAKNITGSVDVTYYKQPTDTTRGDFEDTGGDATVDSLNIPQVDLQLNSSAIVAKTRKLKAVWTPELAQDLNAYHSVDAESELTSMLSEYVSMEIDLEILDMLIQDATTTDYWSAKVGKEYNSSTSAFEDNSNQGSYAYTRFDWYQTLIEKIQKVSNEIHKLTLRGGANFVVCGPKVATILESIPGFGVNSGDVDQKSFAMGVQKIGALSNRWTVYKNPYMSENTLLVGFRGNNFLETGAVYAPYVPLIMTPLVYDPSDFTPRKGVMTRYAKKMIRPEFYAKIHVADLNII